MRHVRLDSDCLILFHRRRLWRVPNRRHSLYHLPFLFFNSFLLLVLFWTSATNRDCATNAWESNYGLISNSTSTSQFSHVHVMRGSGKFSEMRLLHKLTSHKMCTEGFGAVLHLLQLGRPPPSFISLFTLLSGPLPCAFLIATFSHPSPR